MIYMFSLVVIVDSSGCAYSIDGDNWNMVYRWRLHCLNYPLEVSISWIYLLSSYFWFCHFCIFQHLMPHSCSCMLVLTTRFLLHALWLMFVNTRVVIYARHLAFIKLLVREFLTPLDLYVQIPKLRSRLTSFWSEWRSGSIVDQRKTSPWSYPSRPLLISQVFLL